jgi:hypothetical protein
MQNTLCRALRRNLNFSSIASILRHVVGAYFVEPASSSIIIFVEAISAAKKGGSVPIDWSVSGFNCGWKDD